MKFTHILLLIGTIAAVRVSKLTMVDENENEIKEDDGSFVPTIDLS